MNLPSSFEKPAKRAEKVFCCWIVSLKKRLIQQTIAELSKPPDRLDPIGTSDRSLLLIDSLKRSQN